MIDAHPPIGFRRLRAIVAALTVDPARPSIAVPGRIASMTARWPIGIRDGLGCLSLVALFLTIEPFIEKASHHSDEVYQSVSPTWAAVAQSSTTASVVVVAIVTAWCWRRVRWRELGPNADAMRGIVLAAAVCVGWSALFAPFNYWHGSWMSVERTALAGCIAAAVFRPGMIPPTVVAVYGLAGQYHTPLQHSWTDREMVFHVLIWAWAFLLCRPFGWPVVVARHFVIVLCGAMAAWFVLPAIGKWQLGWAAEEQVHHLTAAARYQNGWLGWLAPETFDRTIGLLRRMNAPMVWSTLILETAAIGLLLSRRFTVGLLLGCIGLHVGIYVSSGVFFWKWMVVEAAVATAVWRWRAEGDRPVTGRAAWPLAAGVCGLMLVGCDDLVRLAWYDEPIAYRFRMTATDREGRRYQVPASAMTPYDFPFAQARFHFTTHRPPLCDCFGCNGSPDIHHRLDAASNHPATERRRRHRSAIEDFGDDRFDPVRRRRFETLLDRYLRHRRTGTPGWFDHVTAWVGCPNHIGSGPRPDDGLPVIDTSVRPVALEVSLEEAWVDGSKSWPLYREGALVTAGDSASATVAEVAEGLRH